MADGVTDVQVDGLRQVGTGLGTLADTLDGALRAVDSLPIDAVAPVLGPVGAEFMSALIDATERHRAVLSAVARVCGAAGDLVLESASAYAQSDADGAAALGAAAPTAEV